MWILSLCLHEVANDANFTDNPSSPTTSLKRMEELKINKSTTLLFAFLALILISGIGTAAEIFVQPGNSIQAAVNNASSGDVITVKPGTYIENIKISKSNITIRSESGNPDNTVIQAKSMYATVLLLQGSNIKITGLKVTGANRSGYSGINLSSCSNCIIENNKLLNNSRGIFLLRSSGNTVSKNNATNSGEYGIAFQNAIGNTISGNAVFNNERGVYFGSSDNNTFSGNTIRNNRIYGLFVCGLSDRNLIYNNYLNDTNMTIRTGVGNAYNVTKKAGTNIVSGPYMGGNFWGKPDGKGFSQTAIDKDGDGISDSVYKSITGSRLSDYLPLVIPKPTEPVIPVAKFSSNNTSGNMPLNIAFTDTSTGTPTKWSWNFGDGNSSGSKNPVHTYSAVGNYSVTLTVSNAAGSNTTTKSDYIKSTLPVQKPVVSFWGSRTSGDAPLTLSFTDDSTGSPTEWNWNFGDGTYSTVQNPKHTYSEAGNYTVTLTASNEAGSGTKTRPDYIEVTIPVQKPVSDFSSNITSGTAPLNIAFTDKSTGKPTEWNWSFGDGMYSTVQNPEHAYSKAGNYTVSLTVENTAGSNTTTKSNYIKVTLPVQKPVVSFWGSRTSGDAPLTLSFTDASINTPTAWNWDFGDGTYSTDKNPRHTYSEAGNYTVTLTASNEAGSGTKTRPDYIEVTIPVQKPVSDFSSNITSGTAPLNIAFTDKSTGKPTEWNWSFGDGMYSTVQNPEHAYSKAGNYTVSLTVENTAGSNTTTKSNYIKVTLPVQKPVVSFWGSRTSGTAPITIGFTDASTGSPTSWKWSFGDGTYSTDKSPRHIYSKAGTYSVTLIASNAAGTGTNTRSNYIKIT